jgi:hypothetical protein
MTTFVLIQRSYVLIRKKQVLRLHLRDDKPLYWASSGYATIRRSVETSG